MRPKLPENLHEDVIFFHYLVEAVISPVDFMEPVIVNICHHHLERTTRERLAWLYQRSSWKALVAL